MDNTNSFIRASAKSYYWKGRGLCSVKTFANGNAYYNTGKGYYRVDNRSFLILNDYTEYSIKINQQEPVSSFCLFFKREILAETGSLLIRKPEFLIDNHNFLPDSYNFFERKLPIEKLNTPSFNHFKLGFETFKDDEFWIAENFVSITNDLVRINSENYIERNKLQVKRNSTKQEVYKRVLIAREYLHYCYDKNITIEEVANVSFLSLNHLLRSFKQAFGLSPHQYLIMIKLQQAQHLLNKNDKSLSQICDEIGFQSVGTFCNLFKRKTGFTPQEYKNKKGGFE